MEKTYPDFVTTTDTYLSRHPRRVFAALGPMTRVCTSSMPGGKVAALLSELPPGKSFLLKTLLAFGAGLLIAGLL